VLTALTAWDPDGIIVDEAHKIKNPQTNRTKTLRALLQDPRRAGLLLSGSPVPNVYREGKKGGKFRDGIELLRAVVPVDEHIIQARRARVSDDAISLLLEKYMIRRLLAEVQPDLPKKIRETIEVPLDPAGEKYLAEYLDVLAIADELVYRRVRDGDQFNNVQQDRAILGQWEKARRLLGQAKIAGGYIRDMIVDAVEQTGSCVVFVVHYEAGDMLEKQLTQKGMAVARNDSRLPPPKRREAIESFQAGIPDVYLGGVGIAEGFSLNRASVCVHVQLDYTPGKMGQAEARAQGVGQDAPNGYLVLTCMVAFDGLPDHDNMDVIVAAILDRKVDALKLLPGGHESLNADNVVKAGASFSSVMAARSWQRAQERLAREGITPRIREDPPKTAKKGKKKGNGKVE
jgi:SNF2 family DNA or RNA helicase